MTQPPYPPHNPPPGPRPQGASQHGAPQHNPYSNQSFPPPGSPYGNPGGGYGAPPPQPEPPKKSSIVGIIATVFAVLGTIIACVPGIYVVGWIMLVAGFITAIVALFLNNQSKFWGVAALLISVVGSFIASIVFLFFITAKFLNSLPDTTQTPNAGSSVVGTTVQPSGEETSESTSSPTPISTEYFNSVPDENGNQHLEDGTPGSHSNPLPLNTTLNGPEWAVDVANLNFDGTDEVMAADPSYEKPEDGRKYLVFDLTLTYTGSETDASSEMAFLYFDPGEEENGQPIKWDVDGFMDVDTPFQPQEKRTGRVAVSVPENGAEDGTFGIIAPGTEIPFFLALK